MRPWGHLLVRTVSTNFNVRRMRNKLDGGCMNSGEKN
jgi:hypothetical protein